MNFYVNNEQLQVHTLQEVNCLFGISSQDFYLLCNGRRVSASNLPVNGDIHIIPRLLGGKGGFGSMLRAIGAQIEKTTNREACRDLSGRRLRDINEEQRLKKWIATQADREREALEKKQKKLEKLCEKPKHEFRDAEYDEQRTTLPEKVEDAVAQGLKASCSNKIHNKRKLPEEKQANPKKSKLWFDEPDLSGSDDDDDSDEEEKPSCSKIIEQSNIKTPEVKESHVISNKSSAETEANAIEAEDDTLAVNLCRDLVHT